MLRADAGRSLSGPPSSGWRGGRVYRRGPGTEPTPARRRARDSCDFFVAAAGTLYRDHATAFCRTVDSGLGPPSRWFLVGRAPAHVVSLAPPTSLRVTGQGHVP